MGTRDDAATFAIVPVGEREADADIHVACGWDDVLAVAISVVGAAASAGVKVAAAESCTGGMVSAALTSVPGSSQSVLGGVVSYAPAIKASVLRVERDVMDDPRRGVVSPECAAAMAEGLMGLTGADVCVSVTGIAGPSGAEPGKPVGTVWLACAVSPGGQGRPRVCCERHVFGGDREDVRLRASRRALALIYEGIMEFC